MSSGVVSPVDAIPARLDATALRAAPRATGVHRRALEAQVPAWVMDAALLIASSALVAELSGDDVARTIVWSSAFAMTVVLALSNHDLYRPWIASRRLEAMRAIVTSTAIAAAALVSVRMLIDSSSGSARHGLYLWPLAATLLVAARSWQGVAHRRACAGGSGTPTLIVGAGELGQAVARRLRAAPHLGLRPVGFVDSELAGEAPEGERLPVLGAGWDIDEIVAEHRIDHVIVASSTAPADVVLNLLERCDQLGMRFSYVPRLLERTTERFALDRLGGLPLISPWTANPRGWGFRAKYVVDRVLAVVGVVVLSPLLGSLALAVLVTSGRPVLYSQDRVGRDGRRFRMLKFRSMTTSGEPNAASSLAGRSSDLAPGGIEGEDRRTRIGIFLRRTSLDELPQLFNILRGEMSFVGPRPERPEFVELFDETVRRYGRRHRVKSGITGWAQVNGLRGKTSIADRVECDNYYIENWSFWLDLKILLLTAVAVARPGEVE